MAAPPGLVVYHCYGGAHSSVVAAAIHLGLLPGDRIPRRLELERVRMFDFQPRRAHGHIWLLGRDSLGRGVCVLARRGQGRVVERALGDLARILGHEPPRLVDTTPALNWAMRLGGFLSRTLGWSRPARPLLAWGVRWAYPGLVRLAGVGRQDPGPGGGVESK